MDGSSRHQARERALTLLYEADLKRESPSEVLRGLAVAPDPYTVALVETVDERRDELDHLIGQAAIGWELDRMAVVDRNVLRLALAELLDSPGVPTAVVLDEAVELAATYSTDESGRFVNGVLATLAALVRGPGRHDQTGGPQRGGEGDGGAAGEEDGGRNGANGREGADG